MDIRTEGIGHMLPIQRRLILELLRRIGPLPIDRIPPVWPLAEAVVVDVVRELEAEGAVTLGWDPVLPGRRTVRVTAAGIARLATMTDRSDGAQPLSPRAPRAAGA